MASTIDELYEAFCSGLPKGLREEARLLPCTLRLAPRPDVPWSEVFENQVTLGAPSMFADAMPSIAPAILRHAALAHLLSVVEAFGTDRIEDGQVQPSSRLHAVLSYTRAARDEAVRRVAPGCTDPDVDCAEADRCTLDAIAAERQLLLTQGPVTFEEYEHVSASKHGAGIPATMALAYAAGWDADRRRMLRRALYAVWTGLQFYDDVVDWRDDLTRGGAWAVALARVARPVLVHPERGPAERVEQLEKQLLESGVLARMLHLSRARLRTAASVARDLGAERVARWAEERERHVAVVAREEEGSRGTDDPPGPPDGGEG